MQQPDPQTLARRARLGETVHKLRQERGPTQEELAERAGFDRKSVNRLENAQYSPAVDRLLPLADALRLGVAALLPDEPPARQPRRAAGR